MSADEVTSEAPVEVPKPKRGLVMTAIAIGAATGLGAGAFALGPALASGAPTAAADSSAARAAEESAAPTQAPIVLNNLVLNPAESRGTRFLLVSVGFEFVPVIPGDQFAARETEIRDRVLSVLGTKSVDALVDYTRRDSFRAEIASSLDSLLGAGRTRRVFFPQFVIQ
jgi:flagellar FliL protein